MYATVFKLRCKIWGSHSAGYEEFYLLGYNPRSLFEVNRRFGGTWRLHLQGRRISRAGNQCESGWQTGIWRWRRHVPPKSRPTFDGLTCRYIPNRALQIELPTSWNRTVIRISCFPNPNRHSVSPHWQYQTRSPKLQQFFVCNYLYSLVTYNFFSSSSVALTEEKDFSFTQLCTKGLSLGVEHGRFYVLVIAEVRNKTECKII
jgi:hypothetical protein